MTAIPCPSCGAATPDGLLCSNPGSQDDESCTAHVKDDIRDLPDLMRDLRATYARQSVGRAGGAEQDLEYTGPLFWNKHASTVFDSVVNTVGTIIRWLELGDLVVRVDSCSCEPYRACIGWTEVSVGTTMASWCEWLARRIERIRGSQDAAIIKADLAGAARKIRRAVDLPPQRFLLQECWLCHEPVYTEDENAEEVPCQRCLWVVRQDGKDPDKPIQAVVPTFNAREIRADMRARVKESMATRAEILGIVTLMEQVAIASGTFDSWVTRKRLLKAGEEKGVALYRVSEVLTLAREVPERRTAKKQERASA